MFGYSLAYYNIIIIVCMELLCLNGTCMQQQRRNQTKKKKERCRLLSARDTAIYLDAYIFAFIIVAVGSFAHTPHTNTNIGFALHFPHGSLLLCYMINKECEWALLAAFSLFASHLSRTGNASQNRKLSYRELLQTNRVFDKQGAVCNRRTSEMCTVLFHFSTRFTLLG